MEKPTPRINSQLTKQHVNETVRLVGKVLSTPSPNELLLEASDGGQIVVHTNQGCAHGTMFVEIIGKVNYDHSVQEFSSSNFGSDFDLKNYNSLVTLSHQYSQLFF